MPATLPIKNRTFGVEFEIPTEFTRERMVNELRRQNIAVTDTGDTGTHVVSSGWKIVHDGSIQPHGWECVSPILKGMEGFQQVLNFCAAIKNMGLDVEEDNTSCGFHVHVGCDGLDGNAVAKLIRFHNHIEQQGLLECLPRSRRNNSYCKSTKPEILEAAKNGPITFEEVRRRSADRYVALNMFGRCADYKTVEFRRHSATVEGPKALAWIILNLHMVTAAPILGRSGYGKNLKECFRAIRMSVDDDDWSGWAAKYLLERRKKFKRQPHSYPAMPLRRHNMRVIPVRRV